MRTLEYWQIGPKKAKVAYLWFVCSSVLLMIKTIIMHRINLASNGRTLRKCRNGVCVSVIQSFAFIARNRWSCSFFLGFAFFFSLNDIWIIFCGRRLCVKLKEQTIYEKYGRCIACEAASGIDDVLRMHSVLGKRMYVWIMRFAMSARMLSLRNAHGIYSEQALNYFRFLTEFSTGRHIYLSFDLHWHVQHKFGDSLNLLIY